MCDNGEYEVVIYDPKIEGIMLALRVVYPEVEPVEDDLSLLEMLAVLR